MNFSRTHASLFIAIVLLLFFYFDGFHYLSLAELKHRQHDIIRFYVQNPVLTVVIYSIFYVLVTALSWPGATVITLAGGALFGLFWGTVIVSFASTIGATLAFFAARLLFRDKIEHHYGNFLKQVNDGMAREGAYYLFSLRLIPLFPFFAVNLLMGLTQIKPYTYFWVSQVGMLPGTVLYVNAGLQLATIETLSDIASPVLVGSFVLLGVFPLAAKKIISLLRESRNKPIDSD